MLSVGRKPAECSWDLCFTDSQKAVIKVLAQVRWSPLKAQLGEDLLLRFTWLLKGVVSFRELRIKNFCFDDSARDYPQCFAG